MFLDQVYNTPVMFVNPEGAIPRSPQLIMQGREGEMETLPFSPAVCVIIYCLYTISILASYSCCDCVCVHTRYTSTQYTMINCFSFIQEEGK